MKEEEIKKIVKEKYKSIANQGSSCSCCCSGAKKTAKEIGYSDEDLNVVGEANLGLGCGNPLAFGEIKEGDTVVDLGSGAGIDAILAAKKVGHSGKVVGIDMTQEMIEKARQNAQRLGFDNIEFILSDIESLPLEANSVDIIISNCVINLAPDKSRVFSEAFRVLKETGKMYVSDIVLLAELSAEQKNDKDLLSGCVAGALLKDDYLHIIKQVGFKIKILKENTDISKQQYQGIALESLLLELSK